MTTQVDGQLAGGRLIKRKPSCFSASEVSEWLAFIDYPNAASISPSTFDANLENLELVVHKHLLRVPFSNLDLHYTAWRGTIVDPRDYYERHVSKTGRRFGDVCFAATGLLLEMLRGLGYRVYGGAGRMNKAADGAPPQFGGLQHEVGFLQLGEDDRTTYVFDVSYGLGGLTRPILLSADPSNIVPGAAPPECHRLTKVPHPDSAIEGSSEWRLEVRCGQMYGGGWKIIYSFTEEEFYYPDFDMWMHAFNTREGGPGFWSSNPFVRYLIVIKCFTLDDESFRSIRARDRDAAHCATALAEQTLETRKAPLPNRKIGTPMGRLFLFHDKVTMHIGDTAKVLRTLKTEEDRVAALRDLFDIHVDEAAMRYVRPAARLGKL